MKYDIKNVKETEILAKNLAETLNGNEIILLNGELGAGKTTFTKALAYYLGVKEIVTSPTFAFMKEYNGKYKISHYDMYRVENEDELWELGISDNLYESGICIIEWNKFTEFPKDKKILEININKTGENERLIDIKEKK